MHSLIQHHTIKIYQLEGKRHCIKRVKARSLLSPKRFDLFAKLYYAANISTNREYALKVYTEHIKAFNPDGKEPGRDDKNGVGDFIEAFNSLIEHFSTAEFDESVSIIPVDRNGIILDGAHRVAALALYDKDVVIAQFDDVVAKAKFDYNYFKDRGLSWEICDVIALEMMHWLHNTHVACLWPKMSADEKRIAVNEIGNHHTIAYHKDVKLTLQALVHFVKSIYGEQPWTKSQAAVEDKALRCFGGNEIVSFVFFTADEDLADLIKEKEQLRDIFGDGKDSLHITDNSTETKQIAGLVLDRSSLMQWNQAERGIYNRVKQKVDERIMYFKKVQFINIKVKVARLMRKIKKV